MEISKFRMFIIGLRIQIPYITIQYYRFHEQFIIGYALYHLGIGCIFWCDKWETLIMHLRVYKWLASRYIIVEQHDNGDWWFHPRHGYFWTKAGAERLFKRSFWWDLNRPHKILKIAKKFPAGYNGDWNSWYSRDCVTFTQDKMEYKHSII